MVPSSMRECKTVKDKAAGISSPRLSCPKGSVLESMGRIDRPNTWTQPFGSSVGHFSMFARARGPTLLLRQVPSQRMPGCPCACSDSLIVVTTVFTSRTSKGSFG